MKDGRRLKLTEAGEAVYEWAKEVLGRREVLAREIEDLADGASGTAVVAASMSVGNYFLPPPVIAFARSHPRARVTLLVSDPEAALRRTEAGECDFCVVMLTDMPVDPDVFVAEPLGRDDLVVITAPDSDVPDVIPPGRLEELPAVCPPPGLAIRRLQEAALRGIGVHYRPVAIELGSAEGIKQAVAAGLGVALLSRTSVRADLACGALREVRVEGAVMSEQLQMIRRASKRLSPLQSALADEIRSAVGTIMVDHPIVV
ncbi:LysR substrate-binding domain-containing protein [Pseudonocardia nigra]|uniref:LysR substrate-binding domain-containing protein n=1 Tax=Pseudonocardia nigra TaxID=1921578 RepID=UPI001C5F8E28|nr:LysR substrate-binding domain-containing protein [Pseudonocardia nigra]